MFLPFRLVYKHLIWKRLGREHLINVEVTGFVVLYLSVTFLDASLMTVASLARGELVTRGSLCILYGKRLAYFLSRGP